MNHLINSVVRVCSLRSIFESRSDQSKIRECDLPKIAFILRNGLYEYTVMSFRLTNVLTYFMDLVDKVCMEYMEKLVVEFIGGILIYSKSEEEHKEHLYLVLQKLRGHRLYVKLSKCEFWMKQVSFLSHVISEEGIFMDSGKI
jgi:hypothetical protein